VTNPEVLNTVDRLPVDIHDAMTGLGYEMPTTGAEDEHFEHLAAAEYGPEPAKSLKRAILIDCSAEGEEILTLLLELLGWHVAASETADITAARAADLVVVGNLDRLPADMLPASSMPAIVLLCSLEDHAERATAFSLGCLVLTDPVLVNEAEQIIVAIP